MPKAPLKKTKKSIKAKAAPKVNAKAKKPAKKAVPQAPPGRGFMWKLLKQKQAELTNGSKPGVNPMNAEDRFKNYAREPSFTKFAGPRRRAG